MLQKLATQKFVEFKPLAKEIKDEIFICNDAAFKFEETEQTFGEETEIFSKIWSVMQFEELDCTIFTSVFCFVVEISAISFYLHLKGYYSKLNEK